jgi:hypothetical protein
MPYFKPNPKEESARPLRSAVLPLFNVVIAICIVEIWRLQSSKPNNNFLEVEL